MSMHVYLDFSSDGGIGVRLSISTAVALFVGDFCSLSRDCFYFVNRVSLEPHSAVTVCREVLRGVCFIQPDDIPYYLKDCTFPAAVAENGQVFHLGSCSVLRLIVKSKEQFKYLLGERGNCLKACAEVSIWTKFCEVQMPLAVEQFLSKSHQNVGGLLEVNVIPDELLQLQSHFFTPPVVSNISKRKHEFLKKHAATQETLLLDLKEKKADKKGSLKRPENIQLEHLFVEGMDFLLTDLAIIPCITLILNELKNHYSLIQPYLNKIFDWYDRVLGLPKIKESLLSAGLPACSFEQYNQPQAENYAEALLQRKLPLIRDPEIKKVKFSQKAIEEIFLKINTSGIKTKLQPHPISSICLPWEDYPRSIHPKDGDLPLKRLEKKCQQLENLAAAVTLVVQPNDTIVDFCSGGGHLGLLLAFLLPNCKVVLVENKEESLHRAQTRIRILGLTNVFIFQSNLHYFSLPFEVGVCLHGCGVATDLVLQKSLDHLASFVLCPCCYGSIQNTHTMKYPRSEIFRKSNIGYEDFCVLVHAADQTQITITQAKQGKLAMEYVDTDRLNHAETFGYRTMLFTLSPSTCSPKNNLLLGFAPNRLVQDKYQ